MRPRPQPSHNRPRQRPPIHRRPQPQPQIAGNTAPDLMWLSQEYIANYADNGAILDVTDFVGKMSDMPAAKLDDYYPGSLSVSKYSDKLYGLPWIAQPVMLYYNVDA